MFSNLYPLPSIGFINLGRAQFLCDLIIGVLIDICAHIFQTIGKTAARTCRPFYSLLMKIMELKGFRPPRNVKILVLHHPISMVSLQMSKIHSSKVPKSEPFPHSTPSSHGSAAHTMLGHTKAALHLLTLLSCRRLALSSDNLALKLTGWIFWLRVWINVFQDFKMSSTPPTTRFKCISQPLRHS